MINHLRIQQLKNYSEALSLAYEVITDLRERSEYVYQAEHGWGGSIYDHPHIRLASDVEYHLRQAIEAIDNNIDSITQYADKLEKSDEA